MKRYDAHVNECDCCGPSVEHEESRTGDWVKFEEANAIIIALTKERDSQKHRLDVLWDAIRTDYKELLQRTEAAERKAEGKLDIIGGDDQGRINSKVYYR